MRKFSSLMLIIFLIFLTGCGSDESFTEVDKKNIKQISVDIMDALVKGNANVVMSYFDKDTTITTFDAESGEITLGFKDYKQVVLEFVPKLKKYKYEISNQKFSYGENGNIIYQFNLKEEYEFLGELEMHNVIEIWEVAKIGNGYKLISLTSK